MPSESEARMIEIVKVPAANWGRGDREPKYMRYPKQIDTIMFHRILVGKPPNRTSAEDIIKFFVDEGLMWIGTTDMPYTFIIEWGGAVCQCVNLQTRTPHAGSYNSRAIGVGVVGDFRKDPPSDAQRRVCPSLAVALAEILPTAPLVTVHGAIPKATKDKNKLLGGAEECPGEHFHKTWYRARDAVSRRMKKERIEW